MSQRPERRKTPDSGDGKPGQGIGVKTHAQQYRSGSDQGQVEKTEMRKVGQPGEKPGKTMADFVEPPRPQGSEAGAGGRKNDGPFFLGALLVFHGDGLRAFCRLARRLSPLVRHSVSYPLKIFLAEVGFPLVDLKNTIVKTKARMHHFSQTSFYS